MHQHVTGTAPFSLGNGQDSALNWLRKSHTNVAIFLVSGIKLEGIISGFDQYSVLLTDAHNNQQMIYKAKISTIAPLGNRASSNTFQRRRPPRYQNESHDNAGSSSSDNGESGVA